MIKETITSILCIFILASPLPAQTYTDTLYTIQTETDITYGTATDFAGNERALSLDISYPTNDEPPACGRPLLIAVHGGAWLAGSKSDAVPVRLREDFAKRGYTTASINYRLGQIHTSSQVHCNISNFGVAWDCLNMADTSEWYRAYFRGIQDLNGAIRYLVNHAEEYLINPDNIFLVGESAGGFITLGAGFIDEESEVLQHLTGTMPDANAPNSIYEAPCIQSYGLDTSIASMNLSRPPLGSYQGTLNQPAELAYRIRGVGSFYGGAFNNIFTTSESESPVLYHFHQPNDLIVPYGYNRVFAGYAFCATQLGCQYIINRPFIYGGQGIKEMIEAAADQGESVPEFLFESTNNNADCLAQIVDPAQQGHSLDSYWIRSSNMAAFFADYIEACAVNPTTIAGADAQQFIVYPNPVNPHNEFYIRGPFQKGDNVTFTSLTGHKLEQRSIQQHIPQISFTPQASPITPGIYILVIESADEVKSFKIVIP